MTTPTGTVPTPALSAGAAVWGHLPLQHRFRVPTAVLTTPTWLAVAATRTATFRRTRCPVALLADATWFFVGASAPLDPDRARAQGGELVALDELPWPAAPRADPGAGPLSWWITPEATGCLPGDADVVLESLRIAARGRILATH